MALYTFNFVTSKNSTSLQAVRMDELV